MTISLIGISYVDSGFAASHNFDSEFGKSGISKPGYFLSPQHLAFDSENNLYVTDLGNARIQKFDSNGNFISEWGSKGSQSGQFGYPTGITVSEKFVFVSDNRNHNIQKFDHDGNFISKWGGFGNDNGKFKSPKGITISDDKFVYVVDSGNARIQKFTLDGEYVSHFGQSGQRGGNFVSPVDITINSGKIYVTDSNQQSVIVFDLDGNFQNSYNDSVGGKKIYPEGIIFDKEGNFYVVDNRNNRIIHYNDFFVPLSMFGYMGNGDGEFKLPKDVAVSNDGYLFVTDTQGHRIQKFTTPFVTNPIEEKQEFKDQSEVSPIPEVDEQEIISIPNDFKKPVILVPEDVLVEATGPLTSVNIGTAMATDESGIASLSNNAPELFPLGINTIIWTAVDGSGNMAIASQSVTVQDSTGPTIVSVDDLLFEAKSTDRNIISLETPKVSDEVGVISVTNDAPETFPLGETIVTWTAIDVIGNVSTFEQSVFLLDSEAPRINFTEDIILEATSISDNKFELITPATSDDVEVVSITNNAPETFPLGETIVTWTAIDSSGNFSTLSHKITFIDSIAPMIKISDQIMEATIPGGTNISITMPVISDIQNTDLTNDAPAVFPLGETIVTWTATDSSGNSASATQTITVVDTTEPILLVPEKLEIEATNNLSPIEEFGEIIAEDISGITSITNDAPAVFPLGETIVTWTATDNYENSISNQQIIKVVDTTIPEIIIPADFRVEASDSEQNIVELVGVRASDLVEIASITNDAPETFPLGLTTVTWTAVDTSENSISDTQQILIEDTTPPTITTPSNVEIEITSANGMQVDFGSASSQDIVDDNPIISNDAPAVFPLGETIVTWTATDSSGNSASATQTITVVDTTEPSLIVPESIISEAVNFDANVIRLGESITSDIILVDSLTNDAPAVFPLGETIVTWTATDSSGNSASATQTVTIIDTTIPTISAPSNVETEATSMASNIVNIGFANASDQVEISSLTNDAPAVFPLGETIVTWTATDSSGNSASATQTITVVDTTAPVIEPITDVITNATSKLDNVVVLKPISVIEDISDVKISNDAPAYYEFGETIVTWTATDSSGNSASATQTVTIIDTTEPILSLPENVTIDAIGLQNFVDIGIASVDDIIDDAPVVTNDAPAVFPLGETIVTWTATDKFGNSSSSSQLISVQACGNSSSYYNLIIGTEDGDTIIGSSLPDLIFAKGGDDIIFADKGNDCVLAGEGNDIIFGDDGNDNISGEGGNDIIKGNSGEDILFGNLGLDIIDGGDDIDTCIVIDEQNNDIVIKCEENE